MKISLLVMLQKIVRSEVGNKHARAPQLTPSTDVSTRMMMVKELLPLLLSTILIVSLLSDPHKAQSIIFNQY